LLRKPDWEAESRLKQGRAFCFSSSHYLREMHSHPKSW